MLAVANAYLQVIADSSTIESQQAQRSTSQALYQRARDQRTAGVAARIDELRAQVELQTQQQRLIAAQQQAYGQLYGSILRQSSLIAYLDNFWLLGLSALVMIPFVFLMKRPPKGVSAAAH